MFEIILVTVVENNSEVRIMCDFFPSRCKTFRGAKRQAARMSKIFTSQVSPFRFETYAFARRVDGF